jgi:hypothetical protein
MQDADFGDTVVGVPRPPLAAPGLADADTIIRNRPAPVPRPRTPATTPVLPVPAADESPARYRIRVGNQQPIVLDAPVFIGRRPIPPRIPPVAPPRLVRVSSPHGEVSGTHVEVRQQGSSIIVTDLKSTNATVVLVPGAVPLRLRQGESVVVTPGTVVDIGDGNRIEILPTQRLI